MREEEEKVEYINGLKSAAPSDLLGHAQTGSKLASCFTAAGFTEVLRLLPAPPSPHADTMKLTSMFFEVDRGRSRRTHVSCHRPGTSTAGWTRAVFARSTNTYCYSQTTDPSLPRISAL